MTWSRFKALCQACTVSGDVPGLHAVYDDLCRRYAEPHRAYHRMEHIGHCLRELDLARGEIPDVCGVELALWFHDAVYVPGSPNNEAQSAELFRACFSSHVSPQFLDTVCGLILATERGAVPCDMNTEFVCDIDMSSFGIDWPSFFRDSVNVRSEQNGVKDQQYFAAHLQFLRALLDGGSIYHTRFFQLRYEDSARKNIEQLVAQIRVLGRFANDASERV